MRSLSALTRLKHRVAMQQSHLPGGSHTLFSRIFSELDLGWSQTTEWDRLMQRKSNGFGSRRPGSASAAPRCVALAKCLSLLGSQFYHVWNGDVTTLKTVRFLWGSNGILPVKPLKHDNFTRQGSVLICTKWVSYSHVWKIEEILLVHPEVLVCLLGLLESITR